ncbi:DMT family transporter [Planosporangium sp. 12N6]|uniref:DMT family transporter n=1 Tax=Planosporangium spinosum TaxID=3402278 RepID=UPI003CE68324
MRDQSNATGAGRVTGIGRDRVTGIALGALGVLAFSLSLPATRVAVATLDPWLVAFGRAAGAGALACGYLWLTRAPRPTPAQWRRLVLVAAGVVVGFPLFTSLALEARTAAHGAVVIAVLPAVTAVLAVVRAGERPPAAFWAAGAAGLVAVLGFLAVSGAVSGSFSSADLFLLAAVALCGLGYAEGGALARDLGGARTICWALVLSLPVTVPVTAVTVLARVPRADAAGWLGFGYLTVVSMFLGFFAWYAGLARGGVARVGQIQLAQPVLTLGWSAVLLHEPVTGPAVGVALLVLGCVALTQRSRTVSSRGGGMRWRRRSPAVPPGPASPSGSTRLPDPGSVR